MTASKNEENISLNSSIDKGSLISDDDNEDMAKEYELWKVRELKRLKRD